MSHAIGANTRMVTLSTSDSTQGLAFYLPSKDINVLVLYMDSYGRLFYIHHAGSASEFTISKVSGNDFIAVHNTENILMVRCGVWIRAFMLVGSNNVDAITINTY